MKNEQIAKLFSEGDTQAKTKNLFIEGCVLYSYGYHFPLGIRLTDGFIINCDGYSQTTARHKGDLVRATTPFNSFNDLESEGQNNIILYTTEKMKTLLNGIEDIEHKSISDIKNHEIVKNL